jgi:tetraacyldisaccharide 4'-kinase
VSPAGSRQPPARPGSETLGGILDRFGECLYRSGLAAARLVAARAQRVAGAAVVSVGNLEIGGTGKTPCALWWARALAEHGAPTAVVCRPWGPAAAGQAGDEAALLAARLPPGVHLFAGKNKRAQAARAAREGARVIVIDDGFAHRALARDLDLVLLDARRPFGNGRCLPAGPLREPPQAIARADVVVLSRADRAGLEDRRRARDQVRAAGFRGPLLHARHRVAGVRDAEGLHPPGGQPVYCVSGLARAGELAEAAALAGLRVVGERSYADHHAFTPAEWEHARRAARAGGARLLVSAKDAVRLAPAALAEAQVLEVEWEWLDGDVGPETLVERVLAAAEAR